ncbi:hypothetical protein TKK_0007847 [Trichogramma kaykai]|uniref:Protein phosphatase 1 regulatory subunit 15A/B C-terminal domain-containing protein n=1 Tax=Trichogramma kaykai TaxID=54128 RepID=A0ABD2X7X9_9HYME
MYPEKTSPVQRLLESMTGISNKLISQNSGIFVKNFNIMDNPSSITIISKDLQQFYLPRSNKDKPFSFCTMNSYASAANEERSCTESLLQGKIYTKNQPKKLSLVDFRSLILEKSQFLLTNYKHKVKTSIVQKLELSRNSIVNDLPTSLKQIKTTKSHRKRVICKKTNLTIRIKSKQCKKSQRKKLPTKTIYRLRRVNLKVNREDNMETATVSNLIPDGISLQSKKTNNNSTLKVDKESISNASNTQFDSSSSDESSDEEENSELHSSSSDEDSDSSEDDFVVFSKENDNGNNDEKNISINSTDSDDNFIVFDHVNDDYDQKDDDDNDDDDDDKDEDEDEDEDEDDEDDDDDDDDNDANDNEINDSIDSKDSVDGFVVLRNNDDNQTACCQSSGANDVQKNKKKSKKEKRKAKVSFDLKPQVHLMIKWDFAYRKARPGPWEQAARDRGRFARRVSDSRKVLDKILLPAHRARIFEERFQDTS